MFNWLCEVGLKEAVRAFNYLNGRTPSKLIFCSLSGSLNRIEKSVKMDFN